MALKIGVVANMTVRYALKFVLIQTDANYIVLRKLYSLSINIGVKNRIFRDDIGFFAFENYLLLGTSFFYRKRPIRVRNNGRRVVVGHCSTHMFEYRVRCTQ